MLAKSLKRGMSALLLAVGALSAQASLVTTTLHHVVIGGTTYDVTFSQGGDGLTAFNDVFGTGTPSLTFTSAASALDAAWAIQAAADAANADTTPTGSDNGFVLAFGNLGSAFSYYSVFSDNPYVDGVFGPWSNPRTMLLAASFATFSEVTTVPEPASLALAGVALAGLLLSRRARRSGVRAEAASG